MISIPLSNSEKSAIIKEIIAKGLAVIILVTWVTVLTYQNFNLSKKIDSLQHQMWQMQNDVIKENTKALYEFNIKSR